MKKLFLILFATALLSSCNSKQGIPQGDDQGCEADVISREDLVDLLYSKSLDGVQFIDIRTPKEFALGHILNAINMPMNDFFNKKAFAKIDKDAVLILYGEDVSSPKIIALLAGHYYQSQFYTVGGGYEFIKNKILDGFGVYSGIYDDEDPIVDFEKAAAEVRSRVGSKATKPKKKTSLSKRPLIRRKKKSVSGGCG